MLPTTYYGNQETPLTQSTQQLVCANIHLRKALFDRIGQHGGGGRPSFRLMAKWFLQSAADVLAMADADSRREGVSRCEFGFWSLSEAWIFIVCLLLACGKRQL